MILLYSGGLDSFIAWHYLNKPKTLYFSLGHRYQRKEIRAIFDTIPSTIIDNRLRLSEFEKLDADIPMRNAFLLMLASYYEDNIVLVVQKGEMSIPDRSPKFFEQFSNWLTFLNERPITISSPFFEMTKTQMVAWFCKNFPDDIEYLKLTSSCYDPTYGPCGRCGACFRRWVAFQNNGIHEPMRSDILAWDQIPVYVEKMKAGKYDELRTTETFGALRKAGYKVD